MKTKINNDIISPATKYRYKSSEEQDELLHT